MRIVLISTYELGRQPFGIVSAAAWLREHEVTCLDLSRETLNDSVVRSADLIAIYLPMHTATRLAAELLPKLRKLNPNSYLCCYGLYAPMNADYLHTLGVRAIFGGECEKELAELANRLSSETRESGAPRQDFSSQQREPIISLERLTFEVPDRSGMPALEKYAHLIMPGDGYRVVGSTEASRGCKHLCRHCPIVPVYNGVFRIVSRDVVLQDIRQQVASGAQHISFGDPDFFNGIRHALEIVEAFHSEFPAITYDVTIKIEHLCKYEQHLPRLRETGCLFVISAVESVDDDILRQLDKGHTKEDFLHVVHKFRSVGLTLHPTFVPFTPWTTLDGYLHLLEVLYHEGLVENVAPIQMGIRLLIPKGSRLLELDEVRRMVGPFDASALAYPWKNSDPRLDALSEAVQAIAAETDRRKEPRSVAFAKIWEAAHRAAGREAPVLAPSLLAANSAVPFLSEPWYCCAEPTRDQLVGIGATHPITVREVATPTVDSFV